MKKIAPRTAFFSLSCSSRKTLVANQCRQFLSGKLLFYKNKAVSFFCFSFLLSILGSNNAQGQQVIGSFPTMEGGIEGLAVTGLGFPIGTASYTNGANVTTYSRNNNNATTTCTFIRGTGGNSGPKCISWTNASTSAELFTPTATSDAVLNATSYVVQFYARQDTSDKSRTFSVRVSVNGNNFGSGIATTQSGTLSYQKFTAIVTSGTVAGTGKTGYIGIKPTGGGSFNSANYLLDDFCMYAGNAVDNAAPDEVTSPSVISSTGSSLNLGWSAPGTGIDGGGYVVIRYATNPVAEPAPIVNGIYAVGNTVGTGTIVYIGNGTSFNNTGLASNTAYYYRVYVADKAFNYSPTPITVAGYTGTAGPTAVTFTTPASCITDRITISWTGPLNYNSANNTLLGFIKSGSAVTIGTPTNALAGYTPSTTFGTGTVYQNDPLAYCIINGDGTNSAGDHSGLIITGLTPNTTYHVLLFNVVNVSTTYSAGSTGNGTTLNSLAEPANNPTGLVKGAVTTSNIPLTWTGAIGAPAPTGYFVSASNTWYPSDPTDFIDPADQTSILSGTANAKTAAVSYSGFTGFSAGTMYYLKVNSYTNSGACINYKTGGPAINVATLPNAVGVPVLNIAGGTGTVNWTAATGYNNTTNTTVVFVSSSPITAGTATANPGLYGPSTTFNAGTPYQLDANAKCIFRGDATSATVTGLVAGTTYYVLILTVMESPNYDLTYSSSVYATTSALYNNVNEYTWQGGAAGSWIVPANWNPNRNTPAAVDVLIFNTIGNVTATNVPTETIAKLAITTGNVTLQSAAASTLSFTDNNGAAFNDLTISGGNSLTLGTAVSMTLNANVTADVTGTLTVNSGNVYNTNNAGCNTTVQGTLNCYGSVTSTLASRFIVASGGIYNHGVNGGTIPTGTWNCNSTCLITGMTSTQNMTGHGQTYSKFVWDCPSQSHFFVLGENINKASGPYVVITDSFIVKRTGTDLLQLTSSGGQNNMTCGNYFQYGGLVAITYNTDAGGLQRSLIVNNTFYVTDSLLANTKFQLINNPSDTNNINGRLYVKGNFEMHSTLSASILEATKNPGNPSVAELWFNGSTTQYARFSTVSGNVDFVTDHTGTGVTLGTDVTANKFKLVRGTFFIAANTLTIKDSVTYPSPGAGTIGGSALSNLTLNGIAGALSFYNGYRTLKNFTQTVGSTASLGTELAITAGATPGRDSLGIGAILTTNDNLILRSDANGTARMAKIPVNGSGVALATINDKVTVERYLPMNLSSDARRWRLLTAPFKTSNSPTINAAWQEGSSNPDRLTPLSYNPKPGYGTHITRSTLFGADGYDQGSTNNSSIYYYSAGTWAIPANTNSVKITDNNGCYMLFARGDRSIVVSTTTINAGPTTLDPKGELNLGDVTMALGAGYRTVGNPYASEIKLDNILFNDTAGNKKTIYLWDPKTLGSFNVGKFITCSGDGGSPATYTYTGNTSAYNSKPGVIESSAAFMVQGNGGNIVFHESDKTIESSTIGISSRPSAARNSFGTIRKLYTDLFVVMAQGPVLADGVANAYNTNYKNSIEYFDAPKLTTFTSREELSIKREGQLFAIERRKKINKADTIFLNISRLNQTGYQFGFRPEDFDNSYAAFLIDNFLGTTTPISLAQRSVVSFSVTADPASGAGGRFYIIFRKPLAKKRVNLGAALRSADITLEWKNTEEDEDDKGPNWVERSTDGIHFTTIANTTPGANIAARTDQQWLDQNPLPGDYWYRIRFINEENSPAYSNIVKVTKSINLELPTVQPNPVTGGRINLHMGQLPEGTYNVRVSNRLNQVIYTGSINHQNSNTVEIINVGQNNIQGLYNLEIIAGNLPVTTLSVMIQ